jgi:hypothetical protein
VGSALIEGILVGREVTSNEDDNRLCDSKRGACPDTLLPEPLFDSEAEDIDGLVCMRGGLEITLNPRSLFPGRPRVGVTFASSSLEFAFEFIFDAASCAVSLNGECTDFVGDAVSGLSVNRLGLGGPLCSEALNRLSGVL